MLNRISSNIEPWGKPLKISRKELKTDPILTR